MIKRSKQLFVAFLAICILFSVALYASAQEIVPRTVKVRVTATNAVTNAVEAVSGAEVNIYYGSGEGAKVVATALSGTDGYVTLTIPAEYSSEVAYRKLTVAANKVVAQGKGINGDLRDALFDVYDEYGEPRVKLSLHSETIDNDGNWLGKALPTSGEAVDIVFVIDVSGSMQGTIDNVKNNIRYFSNYLDEKSLDLRIAVIEYNSDQRDTLVFGVDKMQRELNNAVWMADTSDMESILGSMHATGGGAEIPIDALGYLADDNTILWRSNAQKFAFFFTDENGNNDSNNRWGYSSIPQIAGLLKNEGVITSVITDMNASFESTYGTLYHQTGGRKVDIYSTNFYTELMELADDIIGATQSEVELHLSEPRMHVNYSVCYYSDSEAERFDQNYYNELCGSLKEFSHDLAQATDGHVLINKFFVFNTSDRANFYVSGKLDSQGNYVITNAPTSAMADVRIVSSIGDGVIIVSNAHTNGFFDSKMYLAATSEDVSQTGGIFDFAGLTRGKREFTRIQMTAVKYNNKSFSDPEYADTITHETGHYLLGLYDEYENGNDKKWNNSRPKGAPDNFGLMENQSANIEMSKASDYSYLKTHYNFSKYTPDNSSIYTEQYYENKSSCEDTVIKFLEEYVSGASTVMSGENGVTLTSTNGKVYLAEYTPSSYGDRTAAYPYATVTDDDIIDLRGHESWKTETVNGEAVSAAAETSASIADLAVSLSGGDYVVELSGDSYDNIEVYTKVTENNKIVYTPVEHENGKFELDISEGENCEIILISEENGQKVKNTHIIERSDKSKKGYVYQSPDMTLVTYRVPQKEDEYIFMTLSTPFENGEYKSINNALLTKSANGSTSKSELYSVANVDSSIDYSSISWFKYDGKEFSKLSTELVNEENMNIGARCNYSSDGIYVLMAKSAPVGELLPVENLTYTADNLRDGIIHLQFDNPNENIAYYDIVYSDKSFATADEEHVSIQKYYASSTDFVVNLGGHNVDAYVGVIAISKTGSRSALSQVIKVNTGEADRDGDGIPDWYCDKYRIWVTDDEDTSVADSDSDGDGLTNIQEYMGGSDPTNPNDPIETVGEPVRAITLNTTLIPLLPGSQIQLVANLVPADAFNQGVKWYVDDNGVVEMTASGKTCYVKALKLGSTTITVVSDDGGFTATAKIYVQNDLSAPMVDVTSFGSTTSTWATEEIEEAYKNNLIPRTLVGQDLTQRITRAEFAAIATMLYEEWYWDDAIKVAQNASFTDVATNDANYEYINKVSSLGIITGYPDGSFKPANLISREDMCVILCRTYANIRLRSIDSLRADGVPAFADDAYISDYARTPVYFLVNAGIIKGLSATDFAPKNVTQQQIDSLYANATREQAIIVALRCNNYLNTDTHVQVRNNLVTNGNAGDPKNIAFRADNGNIGIVKDGAKGGYTYKVTGKSEKITLTQRITLRQSGKHSVKIDMRALETVADKPDIKTFVTFKIKYTRGSKVVEEVIFEETIMPKNGWITCIHSAVVPGLDTVNNKQVELILEVEPEIGDSIGFMFDNFEVTK